MAAVQTRVPRACLYVPENFEAHILDAWNRFSSSVDPEDFQILHSFESAPECGTDRVAILNQHGRLLTIDDGWFKFFTVNDCLGVLTVLSKMTDAHILRRIDELPEGGRVLVYDFANLRCVQEMIDWQPSDTQFVLPIGETGFPGPCVVERDQEMLAIHNI